MDVASETGGTGPSRATDFASLVELHVIDLFCKIQSFYFASNFDMDIGYYVCWFLLLLK